MSNLSSPPPSGDSSRPKSIALRDSATRMYILTRLLASVDEGDQRQMAALLDCGFTPDLIERLRDMSMVEAMRFTAAPCGLSISVDGDGARRQLAVLERSRHDRQSYEAFIRCGASPQLISRLFGVSDPDVRRLRRVIAPDRAGGGRPRLPKEPLRTQILDAWAQICQLEVNERERYWLLHKEFESLLMITLETTLAAGPTDEGSSAAATTSNPSKARPRPTAGGADTTSASA